MITTDEEQIPALGSGRRSYAHSEILKEDDTKIDYFKLMAHIKSNHPVDENDQAYSIFAPIGTFRFCPCCSSRTTPGNGYKITRVQQQLGLGPVLMLMTTKSLVWLFLLLSIINIPIYMIYCRGNMNSGAQQSTFDFQHVFALSSLGNIGQSQAACSETNFALDTTVTLACTYGVLGALDLLGFPLDDNKTCAQIYKSMPENPKSEFMDPVCNFEDRLFASGSGAAQAIREHYAATCFNQRDCVFDISKFIGSNREKLSDDCRNTLKERVQKSKYFKGDQGSTTFAVRRDDSVPEPVLLAAAMCFSETVTDPITGRVVAKEDLGLFVVILDFVVVAVVLIYI